MRIFRMKKTYLITFSVITGIFYLLAVGGLIYFALDGIRNIFAYLALIPLFMITPVFFTLLIYANYHSYFVFYDDYFEYHRGKNTIRINAKNLRYFFFREGMLTIFFVKDGISDFAASFRRMSEVPENSEERRLALPEDDQLYKFVVPAMGMIQDSNLIINWFTENIPVCPDGQALKDAIGILKKSKDPELKEEGMLLKKANLYASIINRVAFGLAVWCALFPHPYRLSVELTFIFPIILLPILHFSNGWIRFDKRGNSIYPTVCFALIFPMFGLGWRMLQEYTFISAGSFVKAALVFTAIYFVLFLICQKEFSFKDKYTYPVLFMYLFYIFGYALSAVAVINCLFDFSEPVKEIIEKNNEQFSVMMHNGLLGIKWY